MRVFGRGAAALLMLGLIAMGGSLRIAQGGADTQIHLRLRENQRQITIDPGGTEFVSSSCAIQGAAVGEAVTGGGLTLIPGEISSGDVVVAFEGPFFDGRNSGWNVDFRNETEAPITITVGVSAICAAGTMSSG